MSICQSTFICRDRVPWLASLHRAERHSARGLHSCGPVPGSSRRSVTATLQERPALGLFGSQGINAGASYLSSTSVSFWERTRIWRGVWQTQYRKSQIRDTPGCGSSQSSTRPRDPRRGVRRRVIGGCDLHLRTEDWYQARSRFGLSESTRSPGASGRLNLIIRNGLSGAFRRKCVGKFFKCGRLAAENNATVSFDFIKQQ